MTPELTHLRTEFRDNMRIDWDVPIQVDDGAILRADVFRPEGDGRYPVILTYGPYGKGLSFQDGWAPLYAKMIADFPEIGEGTTQKYQCWEVVDPEKWVKDGYVCVRVDSRGAGRSPGYMDMCSPRETKDVYDCIEWAAVQEWSTGKVGMNGISYYAVNQWLVAALQPPHLVAMCPWEGYTDPYRELARHGGILTTFSEFIFDLQIKRVQNGVGRRGVRSRANGEWASGPETLTEERLTANRADVYGEYLKRELCDDYFKERTPDFTKIKTPFLSCANWGGLGIHLRGNCEAFMRAASTEKWLETHGLEHWTHFYTEYGRTLQRRFFDHYLKGIDTGWTKQPKVQLQVRHPGNRFVQRGENEWPIARTQWTKYFFDFTQHQLGTDVPPAGSATYVGLGDGITLVTKPFEAEVEITGPVAAKLFLSSTTEDADVFLVMRLLAPDLKEVSFLGIADPLTPVAMGWLRASHRKLDPTLSKPYWPYHTHDEKQKLKPGEQVELDVEIWPTSIVIPAGYRLALSIRGRDYVHPAAQPLPLKHLRNQNLVPNGVSAFFHDDSRDRPPEIFDGNVTLHASPEQPCYLLLPIIPAK
jgi:predicted acyl esterase